MLPRRSMIILMERKDTNLWEEKKKTILQMYKMNEKDYIKGNFKMFWVE